MNSAVLESNKTNSGFFQVISHVLTGRQNSISNFNEVFDEISLLATDRGFNDEEFSLLLNLLTKGPISGSNKNRLLPMIVPCSVAPSAAIRQFLAWFISNYRKKLNKHQNVQILQWIIGLLDHDLIEPSVVNIFYFDYVNMLRHEYLEKYACKLLCKLTQPTDVTLSLIRVVAGKYESYGNDDKYFQAVLNVFEGYKPYLMKKIETKVKKVNVDKVLKSVPQKTDFFIKLRARKLMYLDKHIVGGKERLPLPVHNITMKSSNSHYKVSSLVPLPVFDEDGLDKVATIRPDSITGVFQRMWNVPIPEDILSLLRDDVGFFLLMYRGTDVQTHFSAKLLQTLQRVFISQDQVASEDDKLFLLDRIYKLQLFMLQGIPCVTVFLSGYLLQWDGLDHRFQILSLIEWATVDSFQELSSNVLRPLYLLFVSYDITMKTQILQTCTKLIKNMFTTDLGRKDRGLPHPFLHRSPHWTSVPLTMLQPLIAFVEGLIKVGMCLHPGQTSLLMESINFYETINKLESHSNLPMWTIIPQAVVGHSLFNITSVALNKVCKLLLVYYTEFLPHLREHQPQYYRQCADKISLTTKYCQDLINLLWNGQAISRKEDGVMLREISDETLKCVTRHCDRGDVDTSFDVAHNLNFLPYICLEREKNGPQFLKAKADYVEMLDFYLEDVAEFIKYFSSVYETQFSNTRSS